jgi:ankyrin repeat protein
MYWGTCIERGNVVNMLKFIRNGIDVNRRLGHNGLIPLHVCAKSGYTNAVHILLMAGADPKLINRLGYTPIQTAARYNGPVQLLLLFLKAGADGYSKSASGYSALDYARSYGTHECIHGYTISKKWRRWSRTRIKSRERQFLWYVWSKFGISCDCKYLLSFV